MTNPVDTAVRSVTLMLALLLVTIAIAAPDPILVRDGQINPLGLAGLLLVIGHAGYSIACLVRTAAGTRPASDPVKTVCRPWFGDLKTRTESVGRYDGR
jgi:hypothetical protein